jgi:hypothetical protein
MMCAALLAAGAVLFLSLRPAHAQSEASHQPSFDGKVLLIYGNKPEQSGAIVNAKIEKLGSIEFLTGNYIDEPEYQWKRNLGVYIKLDQVNSMIVYNSIDDYNKNRAAMTAPAPQR